MTQITLNMFQTGAAGAIIFVIGSLLVKKITVFQKYCIPAPVVGGLLFAIIHLALRSAGILEIFFEFESGATPTLQTVFMTIFFCTVGFTAGFKLLKKGGIQVVIFLVITIVMVILQNIVGSSLAGVFGLDPKLGLCMGSIPLVGGHGTAGSFGPMLENDFGVVGANTVAIACATYGLVAGGLIGGPIARRRVTKLNLHSTAAEEGNNELEIEEPINDGKFMNAAAFIAIAIGLGTLIMALINMIPNFTMPGYIGAMIVGVIIRNIWDAAKKELPQREMATIGNLSLNLFLAMAMMSLKLWQLAALAVPMIVILLIQTVIMIVYANFVVFNIMGRDYEAAAMTTAFCGFGLGATPNAMANMKALANIYGPAPRAFFIVPLIGSLFIDMFNALVLTTFINIV